RGDASREPDVESPPRHIDLMDSLVAEIAASGVPEPAPVVVKPVPRERLQRRGAGPQVVVHAVRHRFDRRPSARAAMPETPSAREVDLTERARAYLSDRFDHRRRRTALRSVLDDAAVLLRGQDELAPFPQIMRAGFLDVDVFAGLAGPYRYEGVPVI